MKLPKQQRSQITEEIIQKYSEGTVVDDLANQYNLTRQATYLILGPVKLNGLRELHQKSRLKSLRLTEDQKQNLIDVCVERDKTMEEIGEDWDLSKKEIATILKEKKVRLTGAIKGRNNNLITKVPKEKHADILKEYDEGNPVATLSEKYGLSRIRIYQILRPKDASHKKRSSNEERKEILDRYHKGESRTKLGKEYGVNPLTIYRWHKENKV